MTEQAWNWRDHWRDTTEGGYLVAAVVRNDDGSLVAVSKTTEGWHRAYSCDSTGCARFEPREFSLVPVVKEPEWVAWELHEIPLKAWYRKKGRSIAYQVGIVEPGTVQPLYVSPWVSVRELFDNYEHTFNPLPPPNADGTPGTADWQPCGNPKGTT